MIKLLVSRNPLRNSICYIHVHVHVRMFYAIKHELTSIYAYNM